MCSDMRRELTEIPNNLYMKKNNLGIFFFSDTVMRGWCQADSVELEVGQMMQLLIPAHVLN